MNPQPQAIAQEARQLPQEAQRVQISEVSDFVGRAVGGWAALAVLTGSMPLAAAATAAGVGGYAATTLVVLTFEYMYELFNGKSIDQKVAELIEANPDMREEDILNHGFTITGVQLADGQELETKIHDNGLTTVDTEELPEGFLLDPSPKTIVVIANPGMRKQLQEYLSETEPPILDEPETEIITHVSEGEAIEARVS